MTRKTEMAMKSYHTLIERRRVLLVSLLFLAVFFLVITAPLSSRADAPGPYNGEKHAPKGQAASAAVPRKGARYAVAPSTRSRPHRENTPTIGQAFAGERLVYEIGFWFFEKVAEAELTLTPEKGGYRAVLRAWTTGFVDRVIQHRSDVYTSHLVEVEGGERFATVSLASSSNVNGKVRRSIKKVDREAGTLYSRSWGGGKEEKKQVVRFTPGDFIDDPLGGFYNFRYGVYGKPGPKKEFTIRTFPQKDFVDTFIRMKIEPYALKTGDLAKVREEPGTAAKIPVYLARVMMSKEVFGTDLSDIDIYFSADLVPLRAEARDLVLFTDVNGTLMSRTRKDQRQEKKK